MTGCVIASCSSERAEGSVYCTAHRDFIDDGVREHPDGTAGYAHSGTGADRIFVSGHYEPTYWRRMLGGSMVGDAVPGPPFTVAIGDGKIVLIPKSGTDPVEFRGPGAARWVGNRLIEAAALLEREVVEPR